MYTAKKEKEIGYNFTEGSLPKILLRFMLPFLLANLLTDLYNMVDMIIIGRFVGSAGIVAVTMGGKLLALCTSVGISLSSGGQVYIAQQAGADVSEEERNASVGTLFTSVMCVSLALTIGGVIFADPFLQVINTPAEAYEDARIYYLLTCIGFPMVYGYTAMSAVLRGIGDSARPLLFVGIATVTNLILDVIFVGPCQLGVPGAAMATIIGQSLAFLFCIVYLYRNRTRFIFDFKLRSFAVDKNKLGVMSRIGIPMAVQTLLIIGTQLVMIRFINALGLVSAAVYSVSEKIVTMSNVVNQSINSAGGSVVAQNIGADRYDRARETVYVALRLTLAVAAVVSVLSVIFDDQIFGFFSTDPEVLAYAGVIMKVAALCYFLSAVMGSFNIITAGTGNAALAFLAGILDGIVFRFGFCYLFGIHMNMGVVGFYLGNALARLGPLMVHSSYFLSGRWKKVKKLTE